MNGSEIISRRKFFKRSSLTLSILILGASACGTAKPNLLQLQKEDKNN